ncbi:hypothetical protein [uncultured Planktomarina sp.]|uniref:hypothetical protein n=1 Tax=uncultured Planktomarina sp. TaxID=1538529 RepID=UPI003260CFC0
MSDIHITEPGTQIIGLDPAARFQSCLDHAAQHHADAAHLFLMGIWLITEVSPNMKF